jgi:hypothetical protein
MNFNQHPELSGKHAFLSPSSHHWLNYNDQKLEARFYASQSARRGTALHDLARNAILLGVKLDKRSNASLATYVNDAIGYKMRPEQALYYSENCFGTTDTIVFRRSKLRIHDLKTGITVTSFTQLEVYAALFCLEYDINPFDIEIELRIYQREDVRVYEPISEGIATIMEKIIDFDQQIRSIKEANW